MKKNICVLAIVLLAVLAAAAVCFATTLDYTWNPQAGDPIRSADIRQDHAECEAAVNNIDADNISDSSITYAEMGALSVNSTHLANGAVTARTIDSGAIMFDTQIAFNAISTSKVVSSIDTTTNWLQLYAGYYLGNGQDSRLINNTSMGAEHSGRGDGDTIVLKNIRRVYVFGAGNEGSQSYVDGNNDTAGLQYVYVDNQTNSSEFEAYRTGLFNGYADGVGGYLPVIYVDSDSAGFYVNETWGSAGGGTVGMNEANIKYFYECWGY